MFLSLAANVDEKDNSPGPIINSLSIKRAILVFAVPVMIVPGNFSHRTYIS